MNGKRCRFLVLAHVLVGEPDPTLRVKPEGMLRRDMLADAHFSTKPHNTVFAAPRRGGQRPNIADHHARAKTPRPAQRKRMQTPRERKAK